MTRTYKRGRFHLGTWWRRACRSGRWARRLAARRVRRYRGDIPKGGAYRRVRPTEAMNYYHELVPDWKREGEES